MRRSSTNTSKMFIQPFTRTLKHTYTQKLIKVLKRRCKKEEKKRNYLLKVVAFYREDHETQKFSKALKTRSKKKRNGRKYLLKVLRSLQKISQDRAISV